MGSVGFGTTRKQLRGYGASRYLARRLTETLTPVEKVGSAYVYELAQVIDSSRAYSERSRIRPTTKETLQQLIDQLLPRMNNVVNLPTTQNSSDISQLAQRAIQAIRLTDKALAEMKATAATLSN